MVTVTVEAPELEQLFPIKRVQVHFTMNWTLNPDSGKRMEFQQM